MNIDISDLELIAHHLEADYSYFKNKKIFITGGTGFFGKWLLETFIYLNKSQNLNISVTILSRSPNKFKDNFSHLFNHNYFKFIQGDVRYFPDIAEDFDLIIHAATDASAELNKSNPELMRSTIMDGTKRICEFAAKVNCKRMLYTSSGAAYGPQPESLTNMPETFEDNPLFNHNDAYASAKLESEKYFTAHSPCDVVIARCFAFAGPYLPLDGSYAFGNFFSNFIEEKDISIRSSGESIRSYLYAADLVIWLLRILAIGNNKSIYNVGSDKQITIQETAEKISNGKVNINVYGEKGINISTYVPNIDKCKRELKLNVYTSFEDAIAKTLDFHLND